MKQKLLLFIALVIGIAACTKEADADRNNLRMAIDIPDIELLTNAYGLYDGVWVVDQQEIDTTTLTVTKAGFLVSYPVEYLFNQAYENVEYKLSWAEYKNWYNVSGYSQNLVYCDFTIDTVSDVVFASDNGEMQSWAYYQPFSFQSSEGGVAIFDTKTNLWTLQVPIDRANQYASDGITVITKEIPPINLVYIAKKKIR